MAASTIIPVVYTQHPSEKARFSSSLFPNTSRYTVHDHGQGYRTYSYEFDLFDYQPEQILVLLDEFGTLRIRASRPPCYEFRREYNLGGNDIETSLVRNTIDPFGRLRVDIDVRPRQTNLSNSMNNILRFDLHGYRPEDVTVRINRNGLLKIHGQHHENTFDNHVNREYYRQYQLPKNVNPDQVQARMDENQILTIELPSNVNLKQGDQREYWLPVYDRPFGPTGAGCCCTLM